MRESTFAAFLAISTLGSICHAGPIDAEPLINRQQPDCGIQAAIHSLGNEGGEIILPAGRSEVANETNSN
jgi:hypothetical protein